MASVAAMRFGPSPRVDRLPGSMAGAGVRPGRAQRRLRPARAAAVRGRGCRPPDLRRRRPVNAVKVEVDWDTRNSPGGFQPDDVLNCCSAAARGPRLRRIPARPRARPSEQPGTAQVAVRVTDTVDGTQATASRPLVVTAPPRAQGHGAQPARLGPRPVRPAPAGRAVRCRQRAQDRRRRRQGAPQRLARGDRDPLEGARHQQPQEGRRRRQRRAARPPRLRPPLRRRGPRHPLGRLGPGQQQHAPEGRPRRRAGQRLALPQPRLDVVKGGAGKDYVWAYYGRGTIDCGPGQGHRPRQAQRPVEAAQLRARPCTSAPSAPTATAAA